MKTTTIQSHRLLFYSTIFILIASLFFLTCKSDDDDGGMPIPPTPVAAGTVSNLQVADVGDAQNGTDLQVAFSKAVDETKVSAYRILVTKSNSSLDLDDANDLTFFEEVNKSGGDISTTLVEDAKDADGDLLVNDVPYKVYILTVADGTNATLNALSASSTEITLVTEMEPVDVEVAIVDNIQVTDVGDAGNGSDLEVTFSKVEDEATLQEYRVFVVKSPFVSMMTLSQAEGLDTYHLVEKTGTDLQFTLLADAIDANGEAIVNDVAYHVFVLSVADGINAQINALSEASEEVILTQSTDAVSVTYICNDGIFITDGERKVLIDGMIRNTNLAGWITPGAAPLFQIENGVPPYDNIDVIMITHNHGDHYSIAAVQNYLSNFPNTMLIAPPQVLGSLNVNASQIVNVAPAQFTQENVLVNEVEIDVLYVKHFNQFGNNFCNVQNYNYVVHMNDKKLLHTGDIDLANSNLQDFDLVDAGIDVIFIPTFGDLVNNDNRTALLDHVNPGQIVALHLLSGSIPTITAQVNNMYPGAIIFTNPMEVFEF